MLTFGFEVWYDGRNLLRILAAVELCWRIVNTFVSFPKVLIGVIP